MPWKKVASALGRLTTQYLNDISNNTARNLILLNFAISASEISLMNSELPSHEDIQVEMKSIEYIFQILNDAIQY